MRGRKDLQITASDLALGRPLWLHFVLLLLFFFFFGFGVIGSELRALYMLDKCSTTEPRPQLLASFWKVGLNWVSLELNQEEKVDLDEK